PRAYRISQSSTLDRCAAGACVTAADVVPRAMPAAAVGWPSKLVAVGLLGGAPMLFGPDVFSSGLTAAAVCPAGAEADGGGSRPPFTPQPASASTRPRVPARA